MATTPLRSRATLLTRTPLLTQATLLTRTTFVWTLILVMGIAMAAPAHADDEPVAKRLVPKLLRLKEAEARERITAAGFRVGTVFRVSPAQILAFHKVRFPIGYVFRHRPSAGEVWPVNTPVDLILCAPRDGLLPPYMLPKQPKDDKRGALPPVAPDEAGDAPGQPKPPPPADDGDEGSRRAAPKVATGSPDAPRVASKPDPNRVPELIGLDLVDAEHLVRESQMQLHVERVPGHPIGKVLEQVPAAGSTRPPAGMLKVVVTAGGDYEARIPNPPEVYLAEIAVPGLLDRTQPQAERILTALGLKAEVEIAKRGLAGRVVDQIPAAGGMVAKRGVVRLWIGPGAGADDGGAKPPPLGPLDRGSTPGKDGAAPAKGTPGNDTPGRDTPGKDAAKKPAAPLAEGPLKAGIPRPVSPSVNTPIPVGAKVPVGFTWRGVTGANAYLIEVEEQGAEGRWLPLARKPARSTAVLLDVERFDLKGAARLRWRVTAILNGRQGKASAWVVLK